jgi:hypothetical protein
MPFLPTLVQSGLGHNAFSAAVTLFGWSATSVLTALLAFRLPASFSARTRLVGGLLGVGGGQAMLTDIGPRAGAERPLSGLLVAGAANGTRGDLRMIWLAVDAILFAVINQCSVRRH